MKMVRLSVHRKLFGMPRLDRPDFKTSRDGLPAILPPRLRVEIRQGNENSVRAILTVLTQTRNILGGKPVDLQAITEPPRVETRDYTDYISAFIKR